MGIIKKINLDHEYTKIPNVFAQNENLSYEARGMLLELYSRPTNWKIYKSTLQRNYAGKVKVDRIVKELKENGYLFLYNVRQNNVIVDRIWYVSIVPLSARKWQKVVDELTDRKPYRKETLPKENQPLQIKDNIQIKEEKKEHNIYSRIFEFWNSLESVRRHTKFPPPKNGQTSFKRAVDNLVQDGETEETIKRACKNYSLILSGEQYFFKYKWTLTEFLCRGFYKFNDWEVCSNNYLRSDINEEELEIQKHNEEVFKKWGLL